MATKQGTVQSSGDGTSDRHDAQLVKRGDSGDAMTLETCVGQLKFLTERVCDLQDRYESLRDQVAVQNDEEQIKTKAEDFVFVEPEQPESGHMISNDLQKLAKYMQSQLENRTLVVGSESFRYIRAPEGLKPQRCKQSLDLPLSSPTACQDINIEEIHQRNSSLLEDNTTLRTENTQLSNQLSQCREELRRAQLLEAMEDVNLKRTEDKEPTNSSLSLSLAAEESSSNLASLHKTETRSVDINKPLDSFRSIIQEDASLKDLPNVVEEDRQSKKALEDQISHLQAEILDARQREWSLLSEVQLHKLQADTYKQDFEREKSDKEELQKISEELRRGWKR